jgi:hypothetical protein
MQREDLPSAQTIEIEFQLRTFRSWIAAKKTERQICFGGTLLWRNKDGW